MPHSLSEARALALKIILKQPKPSNQPQTPTKKPDTKGLGPPSKVSLSAPFIDKISIVLNVPKGQATIVNATMKSLLKEKATFTAAGNAAKKGYTLAARVALPCLSHKKRFPLLQYRNEGYDACFVRLEFVPVDLGEIGIAQLIARLEPRIPHGWKTFLKHARVTRIEIAVDVSGVRMDEFLCLPKQAVTSLEYGPDGHAKTLYLGKKGGSQTRIYSRKQKRLAKKQGWDGASVVRVERSINLGSSFRLAELGSLPNPFTAMKMVPSLPPPPNPGKLNQWSMFEDSVRQRGLVAALALLPAERAKSYKAHLAAYEVPWWDPLAFWGAWPGVAAHLTHHKT